MSVLVASAAQAVGEHLQSPDDLLKISAFRKKLEKEKASIDVKLRNGVKDQLDATREGLRKLMHTRDNVQVLKDEMQSVDRSCSDPDYRVSTFAAITRVSVVHRHFARTEEMVRNLQEMYQKLDMLEDMLDADRGDILGPAQNILAIHHMLNQLEAFRNETMHQAKSASADARNTLTRYFERLTTLLQAFDEYYWALTKNIVLIARNGNAGVIVKIVKIAELEGKEDEKAIAIRLVKKMAAQDAAAKFKSMQANARQIKHYRSKFVKSTTDSIKDKFAETWEQDKDNAAGFIDGLGWIFDDLMHIETYVVPCFPADWDIHKLFVKQYHKNLDAILKQLIASNPEASALLILHEWVKDYKKNMAEIGIEEDKLEPPLLDGKEQSLIDDYVSLIIKKLDEWTNNLMRDEIKEFQTREQSPEQDADGLYGMQGAIILFQMVNQQVDASIESGQGAVLARVVSESARAMKGVQDQWIRTIEAEYKKHVEKPDEQPGGLVDYVVAVANDQVKSADFTEALEARLEPLVSSKYKGQITEKLNEATDGYLDVAKKCSQTLIDLIFSDLKPATKLLFQTQWYDGIMDQIVETVKDYMSDYQSFLNPLILDILVEDLLDNFLITYLNALVRASKLKIPQALDRIRDDVGDAFTFFTNFKNGAELEGYFEVIELVLGMLTASKGMVFLEFWRFAKRHGPNLPFVEAVIRLRDDLDRSGVNEVMESIKRKVREEGLTDPEEPTIMKKITLPSAFSRFLPTGK
ncbi:exocyst complex component sec6 [Auriculariales sp. MPI-PUGE-AT-0066]|nr:exocyst complex component sec6 [Auriculariales sp. MPI-PUGE-AT-0066]